VTRRVPPGFRTWPVELPVPLYGPYRAVIEHHVDGDTVDATLDVGANDYPYRTLRFLADIDGVLVGIDAPEKNRRETREAGLAAMAWTVAQVPLGAQVLVTTEPDPDSFGRYLAVVRLRDGRDLGAAMVDAGHARLRNYKVARRTGAPAAVTVDERFVQAQYALARAHTDYVAHYDGTGGPP
jgi:endonuclease YncB( thermonuclease family)